MGSSTRFIGAFSFVFYTPYKNQNALPDFDSEKMSNTYENLFSGKKYTGLDKISKANDITFYHPLHILF
jgi:LPS-assembly protein